MVAFIRSEKVIAIADCVATPVAALAGTVPVTVGAVVSDGDAVVNTKLFRPASALPA